MHAAISWLTTNLWWIVWNFSQLVYKSKHTVYTKTPTAWHMYTNVQTCTEYNNRSVAHIFPLLSSGTVYLGVYKLSLNSEVLATNLSLVNCSLITTPWEIVHSCVHYPFLQPVNIPGLPTLPVNWSCLSLLGNVFSDDQCGIFGYVHLQDSQNTGPVLSIMVPSNHVGDPTKFRTYTVALSTSLQSIMFI